MPNPGIDKPIRKVTVNFYVEDVEAAIAYYGYGWTEEVRKLWQAHMKNLSGYQRLRKTLGDLP